MSPYERLREGYRRIMEEGWWRGNWAGQPIVFFPGKGKKDADCSCLVTSVDFSPEAIVYLRRVLDIPETSKSSYALFRVNDSQPDSEDGRQYILNVLASAMTLALIDETVA